MANFIGEVNLLSGICLKNGENGSCKLDTGHEIHLVIPQSVKKGEAITVFIRPERITINKSLSEKSLTSISGFTYVGNAAHVELLSKRYLVLLS